MEKEATLEAKNAEITFLKLTNDAARQALNAELKARNIVMKDLYAGWLRNYMLLGLLKYCVVDV